MKILHSADWQLGCAFSGFGGKAPILRAERVATLRRALDLGCREGVDAFVIAGDLFEDNQVVQGLLTETAALFASVPTLRIFILPGNHDPVSGPGCIWRRPPFATPPSNVTVITEPGVFPVGSGFLLGNPLKQRLSTQDPSVRLTELAANVPAGAIKVGITHGALAIEGKHQPNDHPIHLQAATRAGLDYLALGHWHQWWACDNDRVVMPGTPEPDAFDHADGRCVALVEIASAGAAPQIRRVEVAGLTWRRFVGDLFEPEAIAALQRDLGALGSEADRTVVRVVLKGRSPRETLVKTRQWLETALQKFAAADVQDETLLALSAAEIAGMAQRHPLLAGVFADLAQAKVFATGQPGSGEAESDPLTYPEFQEIAKELELSGADLDEGFFKTAADVLAHGLQEKGG